jgi:hypothetical protein
MFKSLLLIVSLVATSAFAEYATYENVELIGLSRDNSWLFQPAGPSTSMVCDVNGPDGFVSVRSCASTKCKIRRNLKRIAIVEVDTRYRKGHWVWVNTAYRTHSTDGFQYDETIDLDVQGWVYDSFLCDYLS